jgi:acyl-CoA dehydrogenase
MSEFAAELTELVRSVAGAGSTDKWSELQELGLVGIGTAEQAGGSGGTLADLLVAIRELARAGIASPIVEASTALYAIGSAETFDTIAFTDANLRSSSLTVELGTVPYAAAADRIVLVGACDVAVVTNDAHVTTVPGADIGGAPVASVSLADAAARVCDDGPGARAVGARLALARSAALLGSAVAAYDLTRRYVTEREQFGAPLIAIPAVSAGLAQMAVRLRTTQSAIDRAATVFEGTDVTAGRGFAAAASARITAADTATHVARAAHQLHGAVGITEEYGLHIHTRRLWAWRDADLAERRWSQRLGATARSVGETVLWEELSA